MIGWVLLKGSLHGDAQWANQPFLVGYYHLLVIYLILPFLHASAAHGDHQWEHYDKTLVCFKSTMETHIDSGRINRDDPWIELS